jgi:hypothetical protein
MTYPEKTMRSEEARYPVPGRRFFAFMLALGGVLGATFLLLDAPFWLFYAGSLAMVPFLVWELRSLDRIHGASSAEKEQARRRAAAESAAPTESEARHTSQAPIERISESEKTPPGSFETFEKLPVTYRFPADIDLTIPYVDIGTPGQELNRWWRSETGPACAVLFGAWGTGKTRLAIEIGRQAEREGWWFARFDPAGGGERDLGEVARMQIPRLLVLDDVERSRTALDQLLAAMDPGDLDLAPMKVLIVAGEWRDWGPRLDSLRSLFGEPSVHKLKDHLEPARQLEIYRSAEQRLSAALGAAETSPVLPIVVESASLKPALIVILAFNSTWAWAHGRSEEDIRHWGAGLLRYTATHKKLNSAGSLIEWQMAIEEGREPED